MHVLRVLLISLLLPLTLLAQKEYKIGEIDRSYFEMTHCPWDSSAGAFYILDYGITRFNYSLEVELQHHVRIKILKNSEFDKADISIPFNIKKGQPKLKAMTYNLENGQVIQTELKKEGIFKEKVTEDYYNLNFTLPNVREGSIIEYTYTVAHDNFERLNTWFFQKSIPVLKSEYHVFIPDWFDYQRVMTPYVTLSKADIKSENGMLGSANVSINHHHYEADRVPAFKDEPYMTSRNDIISRLDFELKVLSVPGSIVRTYLPASYGEWSKKLEEEGFWTKEIEDAPWSREVLATINPSTQELSDVAKATRIFDFVKKFDKTEESEISLKRCLENRRGTDVELNRLLIALLNESGFKAEAVKISTRQNGSINPFFPIIRKFNHTIVRLTLSDEKSYLLDASEKYSVFGVLPRYCLNGKGLVIKSNEEWVDLLPNPNNGTTVVAEFSLENGLLQGKLQVRRKGYSAWDFQYDVMGQNEDKYKETYAKNKAAWEISKHEIKWTDDVYSNDEIIETSVDNKIEDLGNVVYINPIVFEQMESNPFRLDERKFPVNYGAPISNMYLCKIRIPQGYIVDALPENVNITMPGDAGSFSFSVAVVGNEISLNQKFRINRIEFSSQEYHFLRELYARIVQKHGEQIVLKKL